MPYLAQHVQDLMFFDESHFISEDMWRHNGWYSIGSSTPNYDQGIFEKQSLSLLLVIGWNGRINHRIHRHIRSKGVREDVFIQFLLHTHQICPIDKVFILDNARVHHTLLVEEVVQGMLEDGRRIIFQAKYSPDCNPIEYIFGILKRRAKNTSQMPKDLLQHVEELCLELDSDPDNACKNTIQKVFNFN